MKALLSLTVAAAAFCAGAYFRKKIVEQEKEKPESEKFHSMLSAQGDPEKKALLVVSFGSSVPEARRSIEQMEQALSGAFPDYTFFHAYTSPRILKKMKEEQGLEVDNLEEALSKILSAGYGTVLCQPTFIINGIEQKMFRKTTDSFGEYFPCLKTGDPLLTTSGDFESVAETLEEEYRPAEDELLILMGHGTGDYSDSAYAALDYRFKAMGKKNILVGTVDGYPGFEQVLKQAVESGLKKVILAPLMMVAGEHASKDMAGEQEDSWKNGLEAAGFEVECRMKGLGEMEGIEDLLVFHAKKASEMEEV